ncbi:MAG: FAD-dependent oxidoreductase [Caldisericia bacterium]|nr:FAD-dependent oxidoreductase [Caldisericia bacterium]
MDYDVLIIGGGVGGMECALNLGDMGYRVLIVEKEASIGGKMILLSKVFPTLDCASCISTPKMGATVNHENITMKVYSEVTDIVSHDKGFKVNILKKPTFVDFAKCTGCSDCETACTVAIADEFNSDLIARRSAYIAFPQAVPKKAIIDKIGTSPCSYTCPAGVKPHGYISLIRAGKFDEAFHQHVEDAPLVGCLSRACYAPCEEECTRSGLDGSLSIKKMKRFLVDHYYEKYKEPEYGIPDNQNGKRIAIVGSGPAGLSAAYYLAKTGYAVTIFEEEEKPGGLLRWGIPSYRLPKDILDRDIKNITALGVTIQTNSKVTSFEKLKNDGFDAVFLAAGNKCGASMSIPGEKLKNVWDCVHFLKQINKGENIKLGEKVAVIGGGNAAIDVARTAKRLGAKDVQIIYRRSRNEMPANNEEIEEALEENIKIEFLTNATKILKDQDALGVHLVRMELSEEDSSGRRSVKPIESSTFVKSFDTVVIAVGLKTNASMFSNEIPVCQMGKTIKVDPETLQTETSFVFAGGDIVTGPNTITTAIGQAKRASYFIDKWLQGNDLTKTRYPKKLPMVEQDTIISQYENVITEKKPIITPKTEPSDRIKSFDEYEHTLSEEEAMTESNRCLDCAGCSECRECISACPADAISLDMLPKEETITVGSVAIATGLKIVDSKKKPALGYGRFPNVIDAVQMERILAPTRPYNGVIRPSDGKVPSDVAFVLCVGSRDKTVDNRLCSRVCCMYSLKQAQLLMGSLPLADVTIYYIDIRAFGKGYEEFYQQAKEMGIYFKKGKIARIEENDQQDCTVFYEDMEGDGGMKQAKHDLVVLSVGMIPETGAQSIFSDQSLQIDENNYVLELDEDLEPGKTSIEGVFAIGSATAVRDIPDTVIHSGAVASQVASFLKRTDRTS